jgi:hypothetical protein
VAADEIGVVEKPDFLRQVIASQEEGVIDWVVFGFGAERQRLVTSKGYEMSK